MELDFGNMSVIYSKSDEKSDEDSLRSMIFYLNECQKNDSKNNYSFENTLKDKKSKKLNNSKNIDIKQKLNKLKNYNYSNDKHNINLIFTKEEEKTKAYTNDKNYSTKINSIKYDINENEQINNFNVMNNKDVYDEFNDDYKMYGNSDDKFDLDKFNNNLNNKTFEGNNNLKQNINNKQKKMKFLGKKREKVEIVEKVEKTFKTMDNENIFSDINNLYKNYNEKEKIYKLYENKKGFFDKNITIVEEGIPICIIYFEHEIITKIYMIVEQTIFDKEDEILQILIQIKENIQKKFYELNKFKKFNC